MKVKFKYYGESAPETAKCDMKTGVDYSSRTPRILSCKNMAVHELKGGGVPFETWICSDCFRQLESKGLIETFNKKPK